MQRKVIDSTFFKTAVAEVFKRVDSDNSGSIDKDELTIAMCYLHFKLSSKVPGATDVPTKESVKTAMTEADMDGSGRLTADEFSAFAEKWFEHAGFAFVGRAVLTSFVGMVVLPAAATLVHGAVPVVRVVPLFLFKTLFGIAFKVGAKKMPLQVPGLD